MRKNIFATIVSITSGIHRDERTEREYQVLDSQMGEISAPVNHFEIQFKRPLNHKKSYYKKLIDKQTQIELASIQEHFPSDAIESENLYSYALLQERIEKYLLDISSYILSENISKEINSDLGYILNYLKISAIHLLIELQSQYGHFSELSIFSISEIAEKYFGDTDFSEAYFRRITPVHKEKVKRLPSLKKKTKTSFGFKYKDTSKLLSVLEKLQLKIDLLHNQTTVEQLHQLLIAPDFTNIDCQIHIHLETTQFSYLISQLKPFFTNLTPVSIENSEKFITKTGTLLKANNLYKNKVHNPKEKEEIDIIIQQLQ